MNALTSAQRKLEDGSSLTDDELKLLRYYFKTLDDTLRSCRMPRYHLFSNDVLTNLRRVEGYIDARKEKRNTLPKGD